jgi:hypothetical protein
VDLVVIASRGRKSHFDFGSVAEKIVALPAPVLSDTCQEENIGCESQHSSMPKGKTPYVFLTFPGHQMQEP